jgi:PIN domain nuclease of toxin-antitoxin system
MLSMSKAPRYLLDTHVFIWLMQGDSPFKQRPQLEAAAMTGGLFVSAMTCWEISMLSARERIHLDMPCQEWLEQALNAPGVSLLELSLPIAVEANFLPGEFHGDPVDRILVASARVENLVLATRDQKIFDYGQKGYLNVLSC